MPASAPNRIVLAVTGASGMLYARTLAGFLHETCELTLIVSNAAWLVWDQETGSSPQDLKNLARHCYTQHDLAAPPASGSWQHQGMVVCPCSMASLAAIANGLGSNLIHRAADVTLKECRKLILVPRETPCNAIHLRNMLAASQAGAVIMPASPGFYHRPRSIQDLVDQFAARILDALGMEHGRALRWGETSYHQAK
jgi:flavin prenyltransferase